MWFYAGIQGLNSAHKQWIIGWFKMNIIYLSILLKRTNKIHLNILLNLYLFEEFKQYFNIRTINKIFISAVFNSTEFYHYIPS